MAKYPTDKARQGRWGSQVLIVLIAALALAAVAWLGLEFFGEAIDTQSAGEPGGIQTDTGEAGELPAPAQ